HHVEGRQAVAGDDQQFVAGQRVDVADLAAMEQGERQVGGVQGGRHAACSGAVGAIVRRSGLAPRRAGHGPGSPAPCRTAPSPRRTIAVHGTGTAGMRWYGKLIGAILGWMLMRHPAGAILGAALGHAIDAGWFSPRPRRAPPPAPEEDYRILGIADDASDEDIERAYRRLMAQYHPDR